MNRVALALLISVLAPRVAPAQTKPCTKAELLLVEQEAVTLRSWDALYKSYRRFGHCGDVDAQEGYSESIARILVDHWQTLPRLAQLLEQDKAFGKFVGLDATMNMDDVAKIKLNSTKRCPAGLAKLCAKLAKDADEAIAEGASVKKKSP